jgi:hypothetical protein
VPYGVATNMNTPKLDPGEEYPHINTDVFGNQPRPPEQWPSVVPRPVPKFDKKFLPQDRPLTAEARGLLHAVLALEKMLGAPVPEIPKDEELTGAQADELMLKFAYDLFPGLRAKT